MDLGFRVWSSQAEVLVYTFGVVLRNLMGATRLARTRKGGGSPAPQQKQQKRLPAQDGFQELETVPAAMFTLRKAQRSSWVILLKPHGVWPTYCRSPGSDASRRIVPRTMAHRFPSVFAIWLLSREPICC